MRGLMRLAWLSLSFAAAIGVAQEGGDMQAQILYAYQSEDTNQLASLVQNLVNQVKAGGADAALPAESRGIRIDFAAARRGLPQRWGLLSQLRR